MDISTWIVCELKDREYAQQDHVQPSYAKKIEEGKGYT